MLLALGLASILLGGIAVVAGARESLFRLLVGTGCVLGVVPAVRVLLGAPAILVSLGAPGPGGPWVFGIDALSALFLLAIFIVGAACAMYGLTYLTPTHDAGVGSTSGAQIGTSSADEGPGRRGIAGAHGLMALLIVAMALVVAARAAIPFLIVWEVMAVVAYFLVVVESEQATVRRAGMIYLVTTHAGTLALFALFAAWGSSATDLTFTALAAAAPRLPSGGAAVLVLALIGFGIKAGLVPLHFWLPEAHAAAPSHVSAIMSGVVIKMGIYGLLRVVALMGVVPAWWGWLVLALGVASGVLGVVWALAQHDIKRLLAFHSVENIGIILLGMGVGALGLAYGHPAVAMLGFAGAALHTLNHALFKSLLFLGAGSVIHATGTRDIERLGGLARRMPRTAATFLVASVAIVGLPPLNGFVSEWVVYRAILRVGLVADASRIAVLAAPGLALIGALALACFAKVVGIIYLGTPREAAAATAHESAPGMTRPLIGLAAACAAIGLLPVFVLPPMMRVAAAVAGEAGARRAMADGSLPTSPLAPDALVGLGANALTWLASGLTLAMIAGWFARAAFARRGVRRGATWGCGYPVATMRMQYTASSFAGPLLAVFAPVTGVRTVRSTHAFATHASDPMLAGVVGPIWHRLQRLADRLRPIQRGRLSSYLLYVVAAVLVLLLYLLFDGGAR